MDENLIEEKSEKSQSLEELHMFLRIIAVVLFLIGAYFLLTNTGSNTASISSISPGMQKLIDSMPYIEFGILAIISLICLIVAFIVCKDSPVMALILLAVGIGALLLVWFVGNSISQTGFISALVKF